MYYCSKPWNLIFFACPLFFSGLLVQCGLNHPATWEKYVVLRVDMYHCGNFQGGKCLHACVTKLVPNPKYCGRVDSHLKKKNIHLSWFTTWFLHKYNYRVFCNGLAIFKGMIEQSDLSSCMMVCLLYCSQGPRYTKNSKFLLTMRIFFSFYNH